MVVALAIQIAHEVAESRSMPMESDTLHDIHGVLLTTGESAGVDGARAGVDTENLERGSYTRSISNLLH